MKKIMVFAVILILSVAIAFLYVFIDDVFLKLTHPLKYEEIVAQCSEKYAVPEEVIYAVIKTESSFKPDAQSNKGAIGLMQITPETYEWLCKKMGREPNPSLLYEPETNIETGTYFLNLLFAEFNTWENTYAAYNAGRTKVKEWLSDGEYSEYGILKNIPFRETRDYVKKVSNSSKIYKRLYFSK